MIMSRIYSLIGITTMTGLLCFQDMTKKGVVLTNFTKSVVKGDNPNKIDGAENGTQIEGKERKTFS